MTNKRVFVIWSHPLFHDAVRALLAHPEIEWVGETSDYEGIEEAVKQMRPDTVIFEEDEDRSSSQILAMPEIFPSVERIIGLNLNNNELRIYHHKVKIVGHTNDLIQSIIGN